MTRKNFLDSIGMSAAAFALINCVGCKKDSSENSDTVGPTNVDFTLDLNASSNAALQSNGGFLVINGVIVARTKNGNFVAVQKSCTHESYQLTYQSGNSRFYCPNHGATFSETGQVTAGPASRNLTTYQTALTGTSLRIYS